MSKPEEQKKVSNNEPKTEDIDRVNNETEDLFKNKVSNEVSKVPAEIHWELPDPGPIAVLARKFAESFSGSPYLEHVLAEYKGISKVTGLGSLSAYTYIYTLFLLYLIKCTKKKERVRNLEEYLKGCKKMLINQNPELFPLAKSKEGKENEKKEDEIEYFENLLRGDVKEEDVNELKYGFSKGINAHDPKEMERPLKNQSMIIKVGLQGCYDEVAIKKLHYEINPKEKHKAIIRLLQRISEVLKVKIKVFFALFSMENTISIYTTNTICADMTVSLWVDSKDVYVLYNASKCERHYKYLLLNREYDFGWKDRIKKAISQRYANSEIGTIIGLRPERSIKDTCSILGSLLRIAESFKYKKGIENRKDKRDNLLKEKLEERLKRCQEAYKLPVNEDLKVDTDKSYQPANLKKVYAANSDKSMTTTIITGTSSYLC